MSDFDYKKFRLDSVRPHCLEAIATMRRFLDDAERNVNADDATPEDMIERVQHRMAWGLANATSSLGNAISALSDVRKVSEQEEGG